MKIKFLSRIWDCYWYYVRKSMIFKVMPSVYDMNWEVTSIKKAQGEALFWCLAGGGSLLMFFFLLVKFVATQDLTYIWWRILNDFSILGVTLAFIHFLVGLYCPESKLPKIKNEADFREFMDKCKSNRGKK